MREMQSNVVLRGVMEHGIKTGSEPGHGGGGRGQLLQYRQFGCRYSDLKFPISHFHVSLFGDSDKCKLRSCENKAEEGK